MKVVPLTPRDQQGIQKLKSEIDSANAQIPLLEQQLQAGKDAVARAEANAYTNIQAMYTRMGLAPDSTLSDDGLYAIGTALKV